MPEETTASTAAILTGSTGNAMVDGPPRVLLVSFSCGLTTAVCIAFSANAALTGALVTTAGSGAGLVAILFDAFIKPKIRG
jgi:trans-2-enoyl-CoA reductase